MVFILHRVMVILGSNNSFENNGVNIGSDEFSSNNDVT